MHVTIFKPLLHIYCGDKPRQKSEVINKGPYSFGIRRNFSQRRPENKAVPFQSEF